MISLDDIQKLRMLNEQATAGDWGAGHLANADHPCECRYIFSEGCLGAVATIGVNNGLPISEGGNDDPPIEEARANLELIVRMKNLLPAMLDQLEKSLVDVSIRPV